VANRSQLDRLITAAEFEKLSEAERAERFIWYAMRLQDRPAAYLPFVKSLFVEAHYPTPNLSRLRKNLKSKKLVLSRIAENGDDQFALPRGRLEALDRELKAAVFGTAQERILDDATSALQSHIDSTSNPQLKAFLSEAVGCLQSNFLRAATVLTWSGAVEHLLDHVFTNKLAAFNTAAIGRGWLKKPIAVRNAGFDRFKESEILQVCEDIGVFGKSVKTQLSQCLDRRNGCGHPNDYKVRAQQVRSDIEFLLDHVFVL
jgi:hypothetical protein